MLIKKLLNHKLKEHSLKYMKSKLEKSTYYIFAYYQILNTFGGKKKAYIRLSGDNDALNLANKIGII